MVFSSIPVYLDPPNWHQQQQNHRLATGSGSGETLQLPPLPPPPPHVGGSIRPGSMADRARLAKVPQPEAALKCPRCESTNTKFCYFNNYSLTQPRHFCKTCRRYWTRGGALRNVPVGGGCRRNKKSKTNPNNNNNNRSRSPVSTETPISVSSDVISGLQQQQQNQSSFMLSIQNHLSRFGGDGGGGNLGLNLSEIQAPGDIGFQLGAVANSEAADQWRLQQFPPLMGSGFEYPFQVSEALPLPVVGGDSGQLMRNLSSTSRVLQNSNNNNLAAKMEESQQGLNLLSSRPSLTISENNNQFWGGISQWTDLSGLNSSSSSHLL